MLKISFNGKFLVSIIASVAILAITSVSSASENSPELSYQKALYLETAKADYKEAVKIYSEISQQEKNKEIAAKSIFRMVECYEKLGENEKAKECALKLINDYNAYIKNIEGAKDVLNKYEQTSEKQPSGTGEKSKETKIVITKTYILHYADSIDIVKSIEPILSKDAEIIMSPETKSMKISDTNTENFEKIEKIINEKEEKLTPKNIINTNIVNLFRTTFEIAYERLLPDSVGMLLVFRYSSGGSNVFSGIGCSIGTRWYVEENNRKSFLGGQIYIQNTGTTSNSVAGTKYDKSNFYIGPAAEYGYRWLFGNFTLFPTLLIGYVLNREAEIISDITTGNVTNESIYYKGEIISALGINIGISF